MEPWSKRLGWLVGGAYAIGLVVRRGFESVWHLPPIARAPALDVEYLVFGGLCVAASLAMYLLSLRLMTLNLLARAEEWWQNVAKPHYNERWKTPNKVIWAVLEVAVQCFVYVFGLVALALIMSGGGGGFRYLATWLLVSPLIWCVINWLEMAGKIADEELVVIDHSRVLLGLGQEEAGSFGVAALVLVVALLFATSAYPRTVQVLGGGVPYSAWVRFIDSPDPLTRSRTRALEQGVWYIGSTSDDFIGLMRGPNCQSSTLYVARNLVFAVQVVASPRAPASGISCEWQAPKNVLAPRAHVPVKQH